MRGGIASFELKVSWERQAKTPTATILAVVLHEEEAKPIVQIAPMECKNQGSAA